MIKVDSNYLKNTLLLEKYFDNNLILTRFKHIDEIAKRLNNDFKDYDLRVKDYAFKTDYDSNCYQDYEIIITMGNDEEDLIDITIYYTISRINEKVIVETAYEII